MISQSDAERLLRPHYARLHGALTQAFARWRGRIAPNFAAPTGRMRANVLHDLIIEEVTQAFSTVRGTSIVSGANRTMLRFAQGTLKAPVLIQFKKLSKELRPRNYPTQTALAFDLQHPLPEIAADARITVGYRLDRLAAAILDVHVLCMAGTSAAWVFELIATAATAPATLPMVGTAASTSASAKRPRLRPTAAAAKRKAKKASGTGGGPT